MAAIRKAYTGMNRLSGLMQKIIEAILAVLVLSCAADLLLQVTYRFVLVHFVNFSCSWTTEYAQDAIIWITYFTVGICYKENTMASVNVLYDRMGRTGKMILYLVTRAVVIIFLYYGLKYGWAAIESVKNWTSTNLHLPGWMLHGAPFLGCILMAYEVLTELLGVFCGEIEPFVGRPVEETEAELDENEKRILQSMEEDMIR